MYSRLAVKSLVFLAVLLINPHLQAAVKVLRVDPQQTDTAITIVHGPHIALYNPEVPSRHLLFLFLVGTGRSAASSLSVDKVFAGRKML